MVGRQRPRREARTGELNSRRPRRIVPRATHSPRRLHVHVHALLTFRGGELCKLFVKNVQPADEPRLVKANQTDVCTSKGPMWVAELKE